MPASIEVIKHSYSQAIDDNYQLTSKIIGVGSKSQVKLGYSNQLGRNVAIKVMDSQNMTNDEKSLVKNETKILQKLSSLNSNQFLSYLDTVEDEKNLYIVTELINGIELIDFCSNFQGGVPETLAKKLFKQIVECLLELHSHHICHLDLKLENIMYIRYLNKIKLIDFGFSSITKPDDDGNVEMLQTHYCGTIQYTPPEIVDRIPYDGKKADAWSLGVILYSMLTLRYPFDDESNDFDTIAEKIRNSSYPTPSNVSNEALDLIEKLLQKNPTARIAVSEILNQPWFKSI